MHKKISAPPFPYETMLALSSMGYDFSQAVSDVLDNSIDAGSTKVEIVVSHDEESASDPYILIMDNGEGMNYEKLIEAMTLGGSSSSIDSLGKFGMGMKTASLSQCDRLTVVTKKPRCGISGLVWDMTTLKKEKKWEMEVVSETVLPVSARQFLSSVTSGTVILWEQIKLLKGLNRRNITQLLDREVLHTRRYIEMVFHRYLSGEGDAGKVIMQCNAKKLIAWDPFCRSEKNTRNLGDQKVYVVGKNTKPENSITLRPFLLPSQDKFSSPEAFTAGAGIRKWNDMQGFYFYRNNRMVDYASWTWMRAKDEKTKFLRVAVDYDVNELMDSKLKINVSKQSASIPDSVRDDIKEYLSRWSVIARKEYPTTRDEPPSEKQKKYSLLQVETMLMHVSSNSDSETVKKLFAKVRKTLHLD